LKPPHSAVDEAAGTAEKSVEAPFHEGKNATVTTADKADADGNVSSVKDRVNATTQAAPAAGISGLQPQLHASVIQLPDKIATAGPAHSLHTQQSESPMLGGLYGPGEHGTISATPTALEVGVPGGTHGWLKVRAELGGDGSVHASMSSNSAAGTDALRRELPQLTSYLHQEQVVVSSVVVHAPAAPVELSNQAWADGRGQAMHGGSPDAHRGDAGSGSQSSSHSQSPMSQTAHGSEADGDLLLPEGFGSAGGWLSVRA
jgi:hypothetical protein